ncbi:hypothetical protein ACT4XR_20460 (plasmid) [Acinetobacter baumannii]|uniref:hypothetical protein n=1 Tax=Acinetobacter baumannii TaxID=470 RepID=UPI0038928A32
MESYDKELLNELGKIEQEHIPQFLSAKFYNEWFLNKFNHLFEIPLSLEAAIKLDAIRKVYYQKELSEIIDEIKMQPYWQQFKPI